MTFTDEQLLLILEGMAIYKVVALTEKLPLQPDAFENMEQIREQVKIELVIRGRI